MLKPTNEFNNQAFNQLQKIVGGPILDVPCKHCGSTNTYQYDTDEKEFSYDGTGHYYVDYACESCKERFRVYFDFKYKITKARY